MHRNVVFSQFLVISLCYFYIPIAFCQPAIDQLQHGVELGIMQQFDDALAIFTQVETEYPHHPAGPFFKAAIYQSMMLDYESAQWRKHFFSNINKAISSADTELQNSPNDKWTQFYLGAAYIYKGSQFIREQKFFPSVSAVQKGLGYLRRLARQDSSLCDIYLGIGSYDYWRSILTANFSWMPFFPDRRRQGIDEVKKSADCAVFSRWAAWSNLCWISIKENQFDEAIYYAQLGLDRFPRSRFYLWPMADAQFKKGNYAAAVMSYKMLLESIQKEKINNHYNEIVIYLRLAQCYEKLGKIARAEKYCESVITLNVDTEIFERAKDKKRTARKMLNRLLKEVD